MIIPVRSATILEMLQPDRPAYRGQLLIDQISNESRTCRHRRVVLGLFFGDARHIYDLPGLTSGRTGFLSVGFETSRHIHFIRVL